MFISKETIAVFDCLKFNKRSFAFIAAVNKINAIVADKGIPTDIKTQLKRMDIQLYLVEVEKPDNFNH